MRRVYEHDGVFLATIWGGSASGWQAHAHPLRLPKMRSVVRPAHKGSLPPRWRGFLLHTWYAVTYSFNSILWERFFLSLYLSRPLGTLFVCPAWRIAVPFHAKTSGTHKTASSAPRVHPGRRRVLTRLRFKSSDNSFSICASKLCAAIGQQCLRVY